MVNTSLLTLHGLNYSINTMYPITQYVECLQEKESLEVHNINRKENGQQSKKPQLQRHLIKLLIINQTLFLFLGILFTMMSFMLLGYIYLLGNVLLAWATLQQPYISKTLSSPPPQNKNDWVHSVIFELQPKMQLTRSSYKITSFLIFNPFYKVFNL